MGHPIMVGCDLHDRTMLLKIARGLEPPRTVSVPNSRDGRQRMIADLKALAQGDRIVFAYEASGQGFGLHDELTAEGIECRVLAPTKLARSPRSKRQKTDEKDAEGLLEILRGHLLAGNHLPTVWVPDRQTRQDREVVRARLDAADKLTAVKTQLKSLLKRNGVVRPEELGQGWTRGYLAWLTRMSAQTEQSPGFCCALGSLLRQITALEQEIKHLNQALLKLAATPRHAGPLAEMAKLVGVGVLTALVFLTEIGDLRRFANRRQLSAYLGLAPMAHESGECGDRKGHITRQGPARVRRVLCQASWSRVRSDQQAQSAYHRLVSKNPKRKKIALVAAMRRLAILMWHRGRGDSPPPTSAAGSRREACSAPAA